MSFYAQNKVQLNDGGSDFNTIVSVLLHPKTSIFNFSFRLVVLSLKCEEKYLE